MPRTTRHLVACSLVIAACTSQPPPTAGPSAARAARPAVRASLPPGEAAEPVSPGTASAVPASPSAAGGSPPAPPAPVPRVALAGLVAAPVKLISDMGGALVSNNGGALVPLTKLVSNNGGSLVPLTKLVLRSTPYRLLAATEQVTLAGVTVEALDAAGKPVPGPDGKPLTAVTDAQGAYAFTQPLPADPVVLRVDLGPKGGQLVAIAPSVQASRSADLDLISTLTSAYVLEKYVRTQADPVATLRKLPADVEAAARGRAAEAVAAGSVPVPATLAGAQVVETVEELRRVDRSVNERLKEIRCLLVLAGQCDRGAGQPATSVSLGSVSGLAVASSGDLLLSTVSVPSGTAKVKQGRIWRLGADGRLAQAVEDTDPFVNTTGSDGALVPAFRAFAADARGRTLVLAGNRLGRLEEDGFVTEVARDLDSSGPVRLDATGAGWTVVRTAAPGGAETLRVRRLGAGGGDSTRAASPPVSGGCAVQLGADGRATAFDNLEGARHSYDPVADAWTRAAETTVGRTAFCSVDPGGTLFVLEPLARTLSLLRADGTLALLANLPAHVQALPFGSSFNARNAQISQFAACQGQEGAVYMVDFSGRVYRVAGGGLTLMAGLPRTGGVGGEATAVSLDQPVALAQLPTGDFLVADAGRHQLLRVTPERQVTAWAGNGQEGMASDGQARAEAPLSGIVRMRVAANGDVYLLQQSLIDPSWFFGNPQAPLGKAPPQLLRIGPDGVVRVVAKVTGMALGNSFTLAGGVPYVSTALPTTTNPHLVRVGAGGTLEPISLTLPAAGPGQRLLGVVGGDASGQLWLVAGPMETSVPTATLFSWTPAGGLQAIVTDTSIRGLFDNGYAFGHVVVDAQGRLVFGDPGSASVWRLDPGARSYTCLAGPGGRAFTGTSPDDSVAAPVDVDFAPNGDLLVLDGASKQVKVIRADRL